MRRVVTVVLLGAAVRIQADPREMDVIREKFKRLEAPIRREMDARLKPLRQAYANELEVCAKRLELEGRADEAGDVRRERAKVLDEEGVRTCGGAERSDAAVREAPRQLPVAVERIKTREELLAAAKTKLNAGQYALAERMFFKNFALDSAGGEGYCRLGCAGVKEDGVFRNSDLTAEVRYLVVLEGAPLIFDSAVELLAPVERVRGMAVMPGGTWFEFDRRELPSKPLAARCRIYYFGVAVFETEWVRSGDSSRYDQAGKRPWWQDRNYGGLVNLNTATAQELSMELGIKAASVTDLLKKRPFFTKEEIVKRVTGIGKKTYELLEEKICVR